MINIEELKADRAAGTQGDWSIVRYDAGDGDVPDNTPMINGPPEYDAAVVHWDGFKQRYWSSAHGDDRAIDANARRIARLPQLEAAYIEAVEALKPFAGACMMTNIADESNIDDTLAAMKITYGDLRRARRVLGLVP